MTLIKVLPNFNGSLYFAVFNCHKNDQKQARERVIQKHGKDAYDRDVKPLISKGVMGIFNQKPNRATRCYALAVAKRSDDRYGQKC